MAIPTSIRNQLLEYQATAVQALGRRIVTRQLLDVVAARPAPAACHPFDALLEQLFFFDRQFATDAVVMEGARPASGDDIEPCEVAARATAVAHRHVRDCTASRRGHPETNGRSGSSAALRSPTPLRPETRALPVAVVAVVAVMRSVVGRRTPRPAPGALGGPLA